MKKFKIVWRHGVEEIGEGETRAQALNNLGYGAGALAALDYIEELPGGTRKFAVAIVNHYKELGLEIIEAPTIREAVQKYSFYNMETELVEEQIEHRKWLDSLEDDLYSIQQAFYKIDLDLEVKEL